MNQKNYIKLVGVKRENDVIFWVAEQNTTPKFSYKASNGVLIISDLDPDWYCAISKLFVRGTNKEKDDAILRCDHRDWVKIKEAVRELNQRELSVSLRYSVEVVE